MAMFVIIESSCQKNGENNNPNNPIETGNLTDIDGNVYKTIKIGSQWWMAENLKVTKYRNGDPIPNVTVNVSWAALTSGAYCWYNNDATTNKVTYGGLYNWYAVIDKRIIAPTGWHIPTLAEFTTLVNYLGGAVGGKLKETGSTHWASPNTGATNESGYTALPGGLRGINGKFYSILEFGYWWSTSEFNANNAHSSHYLYSTGSNSSGGNYQKYYGFSVRCIKD